MTASHSHQGILLCTAVKRQHVLSPCAKQCLQLMASIDPGRLFKSSVVSAMERHRGISEDRVGSKNAQVGSSDQLLVGLGSQGQGSSNDNVRNA